MNLTAELAKKLLDSDEIAKLEQGSTVKVFMDVVNIDASISKTEKEFIEKALSNIVDNLEIGMYLDISLFKQNSTEYGATRITNTNGQMIQVSIIVPANIMTDAPLTGDNARVKNAFLLMIHSLAVLIMLYMHGRKKDIG